ncbi:hypothetical protein ATX00_09240 [Oenococcus oeni]|nr:hypothetical protein ATX00_09240 [Oenococcus oeni]
MSFTLLIVYISIGILAGVFGAVLGLGGGMIVTPILVLGFNLPIHYAIAASIIAVIGTSSGAGGRRLGSSQSWSYFIQWHQNGFLCQPITWQRGIDNCFANRK